jgi:hypothetical protein
VDRHGSVRLYVRKRGKGKIRLRQQPGTREFLDEYWAAVKGEAPAGADRSKIASPEKGTLRWLCTQYYGSADFKFKNLTPRTQYVRRRILDGLCAHDGGKPYAQTEPHHVRKRRDERADQAGGGECARQGACGTSCRSRSR